MSTMSIDINGLHGCVVDCSGADLIWTLTAKGIRNDALVRLAQTERKDI